MLRSNNKSLGNHGIVSFGEEKRKSTVGRICRKGRFEAWNERVRG